MEWADLIVKFWEAYGFSAILGIMLVASVVYHLRCTRDREKEQTDTIKDITAVATRAMDLFSGMREECGKLEERQDACERKVARMEGRFDARDDYR